MAEEDCRPQVHACTMRLTLLGPTGAPLVGAANSYVTDAFSKVTMEPVYTDGDEVEDKNACGRVVVTYQAPDSLKRGDVEIELVGADPFAKAMLSGGDVLSVPGRPKGFAFPPIGPITGNGIGLEVWALRVDDGADDPDFPYAHWLYPRLKNLRPGSLEHSATALHPTFTARALQNANWGNGPVADWPSTSDRIAQWIPASTMPTPSCDYQAVLADA